MIRFFREFRKLSLDKGKVGNYLKYAIGEILLIVAGILIALAINNKNTRISKEKIFDHGLSQIYSNLYCELEFNEFLIAHYKNKLEIAMIEFNDADTLSGLDIPHRLNFLNSNPIQYSSNSSFIINQLQENVVSEEESVIVSQISSYYTLYDKWDILNKDLKVNYIEDLYKKHDLAQPSDYVIPNFTEEDIEKAINIRNDPQYKTLLLSTINGINDKLHTHDYKANESKAILEYILDRKVPPILNFKHISILGSALSTGWEQSVPMELINKKKSIWRIRINLQDGEIKFRNGNNWNQNWGATDSFDGNAMFFGSNIPVQKGYYEITLEIQDKKYKIQKITGANNMYK